ncbi:MAG: CRISPR-associated protein Cas4 [Bacteroidota bacterium]|nr:CRISPR-associated protein Cas4 [Bacteroidota bacterium]
METAHDWQVKYYIMLLQENGVDGVLLLKGIPLELDLLISSALLPLSNSLRMPAICAGLNVLFFHVFTVLKLNILSTLNLYCFWGSLLW